MASRSVRSWARKRWTSRGWRLERGGKRHCLHVLLQSNLNPETSNNKSRIQTFYLLSSMIDECHEERSGDLGPVVPGSW